MLYCKKRINKYICTKNIWKKSTGTCKTFFSDICETIFSCAFRRKKGNPVAVCLSAALAWWSNHTHLRNCKIQFISQRKMLQWSPTAIKKKGKGRKTSLRGHVSETLSKATVQCNIQHDKGSLNQPLNYTLRRLSPAQQLTHANTQRLSFRLLLHSALFFSNQIFLFTAFLFWSFRNGYQEFFFFFLIIIF